MLAVQLTLCAIVSACYAYDYNINDYCTGTPGSAQMQLGKTITLGTVANTTSVIGTDCQFNFTMPLNQKGRIRLIFNSASVPSCKGTDRNVEINVYGRTIPGDLLKQVSCTSPSAGQLPVDTLGENQDLIVQIKRGNGTFLTQYTLNAQIQIYTGNANSSKGLKSFSASSCVLLLWALAAVALASHH